MQRIILSIIIAAIPSIGADLVGARAQGMGGAQVALVDDVTAAFWNPAAFGLQDNIFSTDTIFGFTAFDNLTEYINQLHEYYHLKDELPRNYQDFMDYLADNSGEAHRYVDNIIASLNALNDPGVGVVWNLHSGAATKIGPVVLSWLNENRLEVGPWVDTHLSRLIPSEYLQTHQNVLVLYTEGLLTEEEFNLLWPGYDPDDPDTSAFIGDKPGNDIALEENRSIITLNGVVLNNLALSYGYSFELGRDDYISVGASLRFIYGERHGDSISVLTDTDIANFDPDIFAVGSSWLLNSLFALRSIAIGSGFSVDLGVQGKLGDYFRYGVLARNIIPAEINWDDPRFKPTPIRPELRLGVAFEAWEGVNLALDLDIL
ncbi:conjugal transfer protein TraF, partial [bacterium]|nr:conjugal transfer protein TraF [bacterium]